MPILIWFIMLSSKVVMYARKVGVAETMLNFRMNAITPEGARI